MKSSSGSATVDAVHTEKPWLDPPSIPVTAKNPEAAKALIQWLASPANYAAIKNSALEPEVEVHRGASARHNTNYLDPHFEAAFLSSVRAPLRMSAKA